MAALRLDDGPEPTRPHPHRSARRALAAELPKAPVPTLRALLLTAVARVTLAPEWLELALSRQGLRVYLTDGSSLRLAKMRAHEPTEEDPLHLRTEARLQRHAQGVRFVVAPELDSARPARHDARLIKAIARCSN